MDKLTSYKQTPPGLPVRKEIGFPTSGQGWKQGMKNEVDSRQ